MVGHVAPDLGTALASGRALAFAMLQVDLPDVDPPLCLLSGSGEANWNGETFVGRDDRFGALAAFDPPEDGEDGHAPTMSFEISAVSDVAASTLAAAAYQGSRVRLWVSAILDDAGAVATPYCLFDGVLDVPNLEIDQGARTLSFDCVSDFELLFADTEGQRLADASHQEIHPGEEGFKWVTGVNRTIIWGPGDRPGSAIYGGGGGGGGGGRGGGGGFGFDVYNNAINAAF